MIRTIWGDPERFKKSYYPEDFQRQATTWPATARSATRRPATSRIMGRIDDVLNVSGHRLGTMEIESALVAQPAGGRGRRGRPPRRHDRRSDLRLRRAQAARARPATKPRRSPTNCATGSAKEIGPIAKPKDIRFGDNLPKTRSGKIMRRLLRSIAKGEEITQDVSTLENPAILEQLKQPVA